MVCAVTSTQRNLAYVSDYRTGFGGNCLSGKCQSAGFLDTAKVCFPGFFGEAPPLLIAFLLQAWYTQNLQISIPVTVVAGLLAILILWFLIRSKFVDLGLSCDKEILLIIPTSLSIFSPPFLLLTGVRRCCGNRKPAASRAALVTPPMGRALAHERLASFDQHRYNRNSAYGSRSLAGSR